MSLKNTATVVLSKIPYIGKVFQERINFSKNACYPPGHYYSTIISVDDIKKRQDEIWFNERNDGVSGIQLNTEGQIKLVKELEKYYKDIPFTKTKTEKNRYYFENGFYTYTDAIFLHAVIRQFHPKQIIEIGSGFSSSVMLDTNEHFFNNSINLTFIEPYTERLNSLISSTDKTNTTIIEKNVQEVNLETFEKLNSGDILFFDSTHVVKTGSDVNYILFEILPRLKSGVLIHFHDIFYPFEYPKEWVFMGRNWNEDYFLRAFLMYNNEFEIQLFSHYLHLHHKDVFKNMPLCYNNYGGNLWIMKK
ncbi:class I SAM-dependent methyltransferase [Nostoc sp. CHAB 5834]|nr:class I SAM-dependent methyltransferase [Nostoc sp. CHAB 5834]